MENYTETERYHQPGIPSWSVCLSEYHSVYQNVTNVFTLVFDTAKGAERLEPDDRYGRKARELTRAGRTSRMVCSTERYSQCDRTMQTEAE
jgi:hypothetical protein